MIVDLDKEFHDLPCCIQCKLTYDWTMRDSIHYESGKCLDFENVHIVPRFMRTQNDNKNRTKKKAEVFTPKFIVEQMIDVIENETQQMTLEQFIDSTMMEIACGEGAFLTTRYHLNTGEIIPVTDRAGLLDRKLSALSKIDDPSEWIEWAIRSLKSIYGYELQADSLLIARLNVLMSVIDSFRGKWPDDSITCEDLECMVNIISENIFQMDGLKNVIPDTQISPMIWDWKNHTRITFNEIGHE